MNHAQAFAPTTISPHPSVVPEVEARDSRHQDPKPSRQDRPRSPANDPLGPETVAPRQRKVKKPSRTGRFLRGLFGNGLLWLCVLIPTALSTAYYGFVASDVYVSESKFVVRMPQRQQSPSLMGALLQGSGFMRSQDDTFSVHEYMQSRDALQALDDALDLRASFSASSIDPINRFPAPWSDASFESLYKYYGNRVTVTFDAATSISTLRVSGFTAEDAQEINARLLTLGEGMVNQINTRGRNDLVRFAQAEVDQAEQRAKDAAAAVAMFRNERSVFDPERQSALHLQSAIKLQEELANARAQMAQVQQLAPENPQIPALRVRVQQAESAVAQAMARVLGGNSSLTSKAADYERLSLERAFADRQLATALTSLESARNEAKRQQLYLERVVKPNLPDYALEPRRIRGVLATLLVGLIAWGVLSMVWSAVREHRH